MTAYGWPEDITDDGALARLFDLNQQRAGAAPKATKTGRPKRQREPDSTVKPVAPVGVIPASGK